jgi:hypothetical protein
MDDSKTTAVNALALRLIAEQYAIPSDQLGRFLNCDGAQTAELVTQLAQLGYTQKGALLAGQAEWVWLTKRGAERSGTGFGGMRPEAGSLQRIRALNEVRLQVRSRAPGARWVSGRSIVRDQGKGGFRPDAVIEIEKERHALAIRVGHVRAVEAEEEFLETLMARYDALIVFVSAKRHSVQQRLAEEHGWPKLVIRPIPQPPS